MESLFNSRACLFGKESCGDTHIRAWLRFIRERRWTRHEKRALLQVFSCPVEIYQLPDSELEKYVQQRKAKLVDDALVDKDMAWLKKSGAELITSCMSTFPERLRWIDDPPVALFALGDTALLNEPQVAIVGSRRPTPIGAKLAQSLAFDLSKLGVVVTSGMALGVDGLSHVGAMDGGSGTIAVLGCGLDIVYPARHKSLYERIIANGLLLSEYPLSMSPTRYSFPERNRIVSGLSLGVVIVEAAVKSGTLITARLALEQNKEVMVLPGSALSKQYEGSHALLRDGASLVTNVDDVLHVLSVELAECLELSEVDSIAVQEGAGHPLLRFIAAEPTPVDEIIKGCGLTPAEVSAMLLELELEGRIALDGSGGYINLC